MLLTVAFLVIGQDGDASTKELKQLEGTWKILTAEQLGKKMEPKKIGIDQVIIKGDRTTLRSGDKDVAEYRIAIDPAKKPKEMDWYNEKAKASLPAIYALEGAELRLCFPMLKQTAMKRPDRPKSFDTKDSPNGLIVAERAK